MSDKETALLLVLARGGSVSEAALASGLSERTVFRRLNNPDFRLAVSRARSEMFGLACGKLARVALRATKVLAKLLNSKSESIRLRACQAILEIGPRLHEGIELAEQIRQLEEICKVLKARDEARFTREDDERLYTLAVNGELNGTNN